MISINNLDPNKTKKVEKSHKSIVVYYIQYVTFKNFNYVKLNSG